MCYLMQGILYIIIKCIPDTLQEHWVRTTPGENVKGLLSKTYTKCAKFRQNNDIHDLMMLKGCVACKGTNHSQIFLGYSSPDI